MEHGPYLPLLLITGLAVLVPVLARGFQKLQIPIVVGEIVAGMVIGKSGFDLIPHTETLTFLAEFGFTFLMFLSGLEVDMEQLVGTGVRGKKQRLWTQPVPLALLVLALTLTMAMGAAGLMAQAGLVKSPYLMGLILSTTSLGVVLPVLKERHLLGSRYGQYLLVASSVADFVTLLLLTAAIAMASAGLKLDLLLVLVLIAVFAPIARYGQRFASIPILRKIVDELSHATAQIRVRGAFALMVAWVVLALSLGAELILGAFLAGAVVRIVGGQSESALRAKLDAIGFGFFIPIFFIKVGVDFELDILFNSSEALMLVPILVVIAYLVKFVPALLFRLVFGWRQTLAAGALLSSRLSLIIAASAIALEKGAIGQEINAAIILVAVVTCTLSPLLFGRILPRREEEVRRDRVIIVGSDQMTGLLSRRLSATGSQVTILGQDKAALKPFRGQGRIVIEGEPDDEVVLSRAGAHKAQALVALKANDDMVLRVCDLARKRFGIPMVIARVSKMQLVSRLQAMGVKVVQPAIATAVALEAALRFPMAFDVLVDQEDGVEVGEGILENGLLTGTQLRNLTLPGDALVLSIQRDGTAMVPHGDTVLREGDHIALIGDPDSVALAIDLLGAHPTMA